MTATNANALFLEAAKLYVCELATVTTLLEDMTNSNTVLNELNALTYTRLASITDCTVTINTSDNVVRVETDDNGTIYTAMRPDSKVTANRYEIGETDAVNIILGTSQLDVVSSPNNYTLTGTNLTARTLPQLIVKVDGFDNSSNKNRTIFLYDAGLDGDLVMSFLDITRAGDLPSSPLTFVGNRGGFVLMKDEINA